MYFPPNAAPIRPVGRAYITINTCVYNIIIMIVYAALKSDLDRTRCLPIYSIIMLYGIVNNDDVE